MTHFCHIHTRKRGLGQTLAKVEITRWNFPEFFGRNFQQWLVVKYLLNIHRSDFHRTLFGTNFKTSNPFFFFYKFYRTFNNNLIFFGESYKFCRTPKNSNIIGIGSKILLTLILSGKIIWEHRLLAMPLTSAQFGGPRRENVYMTHLLTIFFVLEISNRTKNTNKKVL